MVKKLEITTNEKGEITSPSYVDIVSKINNIQFSNINIPLNDTDYVSVSGPVSLRGSSDNIIQSIHINGKIFDVDQYSTEELKTIIESMPSNIFNSCKS